MAVDESTAGSRCSSSPTRTAALGGFRGGYQPEGAPSARSAKPGSTRRNLNRPSSAVPRCRAWRRTPPGYFNKTECFCFTGADSCSDCRRVAPHAGALHGRSAAPGRHAHAVFTRSAKMTSRPVCRPGGAEPACSELVFVQRWFLAHITMAQAGTKATTFTFAPHGSVADRRALGLFTTVIGAANWLNEPGAMGQMMPVFFWLAIPAVHDVRLVWRRGSASRWRHVQRRQGHCRSAGHDVVHLPR